jgi:hypothetical protein
VFLCGCPELAAGGPYTRKTIPDYPHPNCDCMVEPRLKDSDDLINELRAYVRGEPAGNDIELWAQEHGLGEDDRQIVIKGPEEIKPWTTQEPDNEFVKQFMSRDGEKIISIDDEIKKVRQVGIAANNSEEFGTIFDKNGVILKVLRGDKNDKNHLYVPSEIDDIIKKGPITNYTLIHYHISGGSFSLDDLQTLLTYKEFSAFYVTTKSGSRYRMALGNTKMTLSELDEYWMKFYAAIEKKLEPDIKSGILTKNYGKIIISRELSRILKNKFEWDYEEVYNE